MIESISLTNFKCFQDTTTFPISRINVLYGMNGRGKSTLLQALLLFAQSMSGKGIINKLLLKGPLVNLGTFADVKNRYSGEAHFEIAIKEGLEHLKSTYGENGNPTMAELIGLTVGETDFFDENSTSSSSNDTRTTRTTGVIDKSTIRLLNTLEHIRYVSAERLGPREYMERKPIENDSLGVKGENSFQIMEAQGNDFALKIQAALDEILGGASVRVETSTDNSIIQLYLDSVNGTVGFKPTNVGFGYSYALPIVMALLLAKPSETLIVENPEAHLHPAAQSRMTSLMINIAQEKNLQLFIETHSDHVINGLRIAVRKSKIACEEVNILHFTRSNCTSCSPVFEQIQIDSDGNLSSLPDDFMDEWTKQLLQLV